MQKIQHNNNNNNKKKNRHGIRILIKQTGDLGLFDAVATLTQLVTSLGLIAVATTITDYMMLYALDNSEEFTDLKYSTSRDFNVSEHDKDALLFKAIEGQDLLVKWRVEDDGRQEFVAVSQEDGTEIPLLNLDATGALKTWGRAGDSHRSSAYSVGGANYGTGNSLTISNPHV